MIARISTVAVCAWLTLLSAQGVADAGVPPASPITIFLHSVDSSSHTPVDAVALTDKHFYVEVRVTPSVVGSHELAVVLYDPTGKQALRSVMEQEQRDAEFTVTAGYAFKADDSVGTWHVVALLDGGQVAERWLPVSARRADGKQPHA